MRAPSSKRPFRDTAILYAAFAVVFVIVAVGTGRTPLVAVPVAAGCFVLATAYAWWRLRREAETERRDS